MVLRRRSNRFNHWSLRGFWLKLDALVNAGAVSHAACPCRRGDRVDLTSVLAACCICSRQIADGLARARDAIARDGHFRSNSGKNRKRLGRPNADPKKIEAARFELAQGTGILKTAGMVGLDTGGGGGLGDGTNTTISAARMSWPRRRSHFSAP
jgi:hypothetical protein